MLKRSHLRYLLVTAMALVAVACGDDQADDATATTTEAAAGTADPVSSLCETWIEVDRVSSELGGPEVPPEEVASIAGQLRELVEGVQDSPTELVAALATLSDASATAEAGDPSAFDAPETSEAATAVGEWVHDSCGFNQVDVTYRDYAFDGMPQKLTAGPVSFRATSEAEEAHVMVVVRMVDPAAGDPAGVVIDAMTTADGDPFEALAGIAEPAISGGFAPPGGTATLTAQLDKGTYVVICPIPTGFTGDGPPPADAPPHAMNGMIATLTVT